MDHDKENPKLVLLKAFGHMCKLALSRSLLCKVLKV